MTPSFLQLCTVLFTVAMLCVSVYFLLGSLPLLILKHDTPVDGNFIRSFFNLYYRVAAFVATAATLRIQTTDIEAIPEFRKIHLRAILISLVQLVAVVLSLFLFKL